MVFMKCRHCGRPLEISLEYENDKSCPNCSQKAGEHIFYPKACFGYTQKRVTANNPAGIQSWCTRCREKKCGPYADGKRCSEFK